MARFLILGLILTLGGCTGGPALPQYPSLIVLGIPQDGGTPQAARFDDPRWDCPAAARQVA